MLLLFYRRNTFIDIGQTNEIIKEFCHKNNFIFINHQNITSDDLWGDGIHLTNSGKGIFQFSEEFYLVDYILSR